MEEIYRYGRGSWKTIQEGNELYWLMGNGIGGYSNHTIVGGAATCFHGYLVAALNPPVDRKLILTRTEEKIKINNRKYDLASQQYVGKNKNGQQYLEKFVFYDVPTYTYRIEDLKMKKTVCMEYGHNTVVICYEVENGSEGSNLSIIPLFNYRNANETSEKSQLKFNVELNNNVLTLIPKENKNIQIKLLASDGVYFDRSLLAADMENKSHIYEENHFYMLDNRTGSLSLDNHYTPYEINISLKPFEKRKFYLKCTIEELSEKDGFKIVDEYINRLEKLVQQSGIKDKFGRNLVRAADNFIVKRNSTGLKTILAGFPWFTDWGRDTMISFEGLTLVTRRFDDARQILESFAKYIKNGLVPNMFPDKEIELLYNTADASLWYFQAVYKYLEYTGTEDDYKYIQLKIYPKLKEIINWYIKGTSFSIKMDDDYLIHAGSGLDQVTWMDVRVGDYVVTPRHGKPVEINALWYNALKVMEILAKKYNDEFIIYGELADKVKKSFNNKFWNEEKKCLYDVVDENDEKIRPNQIWAVSLPFNIVSREREKLIVDIVYKHLYSVYGLRSLSFMDKEYQGKYQGELFKRDCAYHMGTTWAFLFGPFITAYCRVNNYSAEALNNASEMCENFQDTMKDGCINGIAEVFDGDFSCTGRGCYSQAWSIGETLRCYINEIVLPRGKINK